MHVFECDPGMEISGNLAISLLVNLQAEDFEPFLRKYGFADVQPDQWYSYQDFLNIFRDVSEQPGAMFDFVAVGMAAVDRYDLPPHVARMGLEEFFLTVMPTMINRQYRNGSPSQLSVEKVGEKHLLIKTTSAYPDDTAYGFMYGLARRFANGTPFTLEYDRGHTRRDQGGETTLLHLTWE
jgi:hypothetical protein